MKRGSTAAPFDLLKAEAYIRRKSTLAVVCDASVSTARSRCVTVPRLRTG